MRQHRQVGVHSCRRWRAARSAGAVIGADLVRRNFDPAAPDQVWAADVTQFRIGEGWLYLATVLDLWSRRVIGWAMGSAVSTELAGDALMMAFQRRRPDRRIGWITAAPRLRKARSRMTRPCPRNRVNTTTRRHRQNHAYRLGAFS